MKRRIDPYRVVERVIVGVLVIFTVAAVGLLIFSVVRRFTPDDTLQENIDTLQETTTELQDTVDELRSTVDDPTIAADLETLEEQLQEVDQQLEALEHNVDQPGIEPVEEGTLPTGEAENVEPVQDEFDELLTTSSWLVGILSIITALALARVLSTRWRRKRRHLTVADPTMFPNNCESDH